MTYNSNNAFRLLQLLYDNILRSYSADFFSKMPLAAR